MKRDKILLITLTGLFALIAFSVMAQGGPGGPPPPPGGTSGPIDGGAIFFFIGATAYCYKKLREKKLIKSY